MSSIMREITVHLNFECRLYCHTRDPDGCRIRDRHTLPLHGLEEWAGALASLPEDWLIHFMGGDPLLFPGFPILVARLKRPWKVTSPLSNWPPLATFREMRNGVDTCREFICSYHAPDWGGTLSPQGFAMRMKVLVDAGFPVSVRVRPNSEAWPLGFIRDLTSTDAKVEKITVSVEPFVAVETRYMVKGSEPQSCEGFLQIGPDGSVYPCYQAMLGGLRKRGVYRRANIFDGDWDLEWRGMEKCYLRCQKRGAPERNPTGRT